VPVEKSAIYTGWNASYSQPTQTSVQVGTPAAWMNPLNAGQTTKQEWLGFCANRLS
jgi:hypothetical protein